MKDCTTCKGFLAVHPRMEDTAPILYMSSIDPFLKKDHPNIIIDTLHGSWPVSREMPFSRSRLIFVFPNLRWDLSMAVRLAIAAIGLITLPMGMLSCTAKHDEPKPTIRIAENPWTGSSINAHVAKIILEEKMGYPVEIVPIDGKAQWPALAKGSIHAGLEVWPSSRAEEIKQYIHDRKLVENIGLLGVVGKVNWYVPSYVVDKYPESATWEGFKDPRLAEIFKTAASGGKGRFLAGDPSWGQYDRDIIRNLGLDLRVVQAGSEKAILDALDTAYSRKQPILFYLWTPHAVHAKYRLTAIRLPAYSDACYAKAAEGGVACEYPPEILFKVVWPGLKTMAPDVYQLLKNFTYPNEDQIAMLAMVELEGKTPEAAARAWIEKNPDKWEPWLPIK